MEINHDETKETSRDFEQVIDWQMHISDRPHDMPIMDKLQAKTSEVTIDTWETMCDSIKSIFREGQSVCERRWEASKVLLDYLDFPLLDSIS